MSLLNKNAFVTGCSRGIAKVMLEEFAKKGVNLFAHARHETPEFIEFTKNLENKYSVFVKPVFFDITDYSATKSVIASIMKEKTPIDILVNSAGIAHGGLFQMTPINQIKEVFEVNLFAQMNLTQLVLKIMKRQESASIINMGSLLGINMSAGASAYGVSKAALIAWTQTLAAELGDSHIRVNAVAPALVDTDMATLMEHKAKQGMLDQSAMKRMATPHEVAKVVLFLASDDASFINGQVIKIDGGSV